MNPDFWRDRRVLVTGHTGFKGAWLCTWLDALGARVSGYALDPPSDPSLYRVAGVCDAVDDERGDVRDLAALRRALLRARPDVVFHLAAQPLVRAGYREPIETFETNVMGTANLLEAARALPSRCAVVVVTTDKCYANAERGERFAEDDPLGGDDPYAASKACAELVANAFREAYLDGPVHVATARAGNVIGGGDWASDRLVPDIMRAFLDGVPAMIRSPGSVRPWQHVLEPLHGYLTLGEALWRGGARFAEAWNFGPARADERTVAEVADLLATSFGRGARWQRLATTASEREAFVLRLSAAKARARLGWAPCWSLEHALAETARWFEVFAAGGDVRLLTCEQVEAYQRDRAADARRPLLSPQSAGA